MASTAPQDSALDPRLSGLRRMRVVATFLLLIMTAVFAATFMTGHDWAFLPYLRAFAEAGMVGACADWFAIVALFRRPFGLPIPHTAIVPNNKERIGKAMGRFVANNFLTARTMSERLAGIDTIGAFVRWIAEPANARRMGNQVAVLLPRISEALPSAQLGDSFGRLTLFAIDAVPAAPVASRLLAVLWAHGEAQALLTKAVDFGEDWLRRNKDALIGKVTEQSSRWIPKWVDRMVAEKVITGVLSTLAEMREPAHPWRLELSRAVQRLIADLATDPELRAIAERLKGELLASPLVAEQAKTLWAEIEHALASGLPAHAERIAASAEQALHSFGLWLQQDEERKANLNRRVRVVVQRSLSMFRFEIGAYVERVVHNWDTVTLVQRLELQVGKDLQYIRINGTLVGGLVGLLIYAVSQWLTAL